MKDEINENNTTKRGYYQYFIKVNTKLQNIHNLFDRFSFTIQ